ncbi:MAG: HlyD family secretion protein [Phycisphaerales bacterium]|nr:HlyD family secretion protein [Phycisphaerales bacterium]
MSDEPAQLSTSTMTKPAAPGTPPGNGNGQRRKAIIIMAIIVLIVAVIVGVPWYLNARQYVSTDDAFVSAHIVYISAQVPQQVKKVLVLDNQFVHKGQPLVQLDDRDYVAQVAQAKAALAAAQATNEANQYLLAITKQTSNADVAKQQAKVAIARTGIAAAKAQLAAAMASVAQAHAGVLSARAAVAQTQAEVVSDQATSDKAQADYHRYATLVKTGDVTPQQLDSYRATADSAAAMLVAAKTKVIAAQAQVAEAKAQENAAHQNVLAADEQVASAKASLQQAQAELAAVNNVPEQVGQKQSTVSGSDAQIAQLKAQLQQAELNLSYCRITAPADGYITNKTVEPGNYASVGQSLMALVRPNMWVTANFKETDLAHMRPNDPATITVDAYPNVTIKAYVQSIQAGTGAKFSLLPPENATGNYVKVVQRVPVKILFKGDLKHLPYLAAGMSAVPVVRVLPEVKAK